MKNGLIKLIMLVFVCLSAACSSLPEVYEVKNQTYPDVVAKKEAKDIIIYTGAKRGWNFTVVDDNTLQGTLLVRQHMVKVNVPVTRSTYSILYNDSANLKYENGKIHPSYNKWVQTLQNDINK
ncbi:hypothetical protein LJB93_00840, partial [Desulfovibrio sp. OttesenSCG-928-F07]|nr:hypothetical protein [Desulfovibrio sp. OttesenSCG-928-F07]